LTPPSSGTSGEAASGSGTGTGSRTSGTSAGSGPSAQPAASGPAASLPARLAAIARGDRLALSRAISALENELPEAGPLARELSLRSGRAHVLGITGAPGAGKSTLVSALLGELLRRGQRVAILAVDPSSPITGGAVLGDRVRMGEFGAHENVFIRSIASRGHLGGLSRTSEGIIDLFDAAGFDTVIVETVGAGQSEVEIASMADTSIVVTPPGLGDEVQASKAGILEIADILVVTKGDLPLADRTARELRDMLALRPVRKGWKVPVLTTVATRHEGLAELLDAARAHATASGKGRRHEGKPVGGASDGSGSSSDEAGASGSDDAQALEALMRRLHARDAFLQHSGIAVVAVGPGTTTLRMPVRAEHINFNGTCHGGAIFTLADGAFGMACNSRGPVTAGVDSHITYQQAVHAGDVLVARADEVSRGNRLCVYRVEVTREADGAKISTFTGTAFITSLPQA
jgi:LAO/AO transport system ATPase/phenylacetic acid degradation protein PaaD